MIDPSMDKPLEIAESRSGIRILARERWNPLCVLARPGERYRFTCQGTWSDAGIASGPKGQPGHGLQRVTGWMKRMPAAPWFCVVGSVGRRRGVQFDIGDCREWTNETSMTAPLFAFANDAWLFYWNNRGCIVLEVRRIA